MIVKEIKVLHFMLALWMDVKQISIPNTEICSINENANSFFFLFFNDVGTQFPHLIHIFNALGKVVKQKYISLLDNQII